MRDLESYLGGFSSSAMATRHGFAFEQAYGIFLTDKRLLVTKEKGQSGIGWDVNAGAIFGSFSSKVNPFLDVAPRAVSDLDAADKKLDVNLDQVLAIEVKKPGFFSKGYIAISLKSGNGFKLVLLESAGEYGKESFDAAKELFQKHLPQALKIA